MLKNISFEDIKVSSSTKIPNLNRLEDLFLMRHCEIFLGLLDIEDQNLYPELHIFLKGTEGAATDPFEILHDLFKFVMGTLTAYKKNISKLSKMCHSYRLAKEKPSTERLSDILAGAFRGVHRLRYLAWNSDGFV